MSEFDKNISSSRHRSDDDLIHSLRRLTGDLIFTSETDAPVDVIHGGKVSILSMENVLKQFAENRPGEPVQEISPREFFDRLVKIREWYGTEERNRAIRYAELRDLLKDSLRDLKVFRVGRVQIDIYVVGLNKEDELVGIRTKAIET